MEKLTWDKITLKLVNPWRLSYGVSDERTAYWIRLFEDEGWGEGTIPPYYGVDENAMIQFWAAMAAKRDLFPNDLNAIPEWIGDSGPAPARSAVDIALHDRIARMHGIPLYQFLGLPAPGVVRTSFTIAIDEPQEMARRAAAVPDYEILKIKLGSDDDESRLAAIRQERPDALIRVDANAGWTRSEASKKIKLLEPYNLEMVEQPLPREDIEGLGWLQSQTRIPIVADESVQSLQDVEALAAAGVQGINVKLMKVGGLFPAVQILKRAASLGLRTMLGCMIETSLGVTAMAHLAGLADWYDLDPPLLIQNDPFVGIQIDNHGFIKLPEKAGIGVEQRRME